MKSYKLNDIISIQSGFKAAISICDDLQDKRKVDGYIPTTNGVYFLEEMFRCLDTTKSSRPIMLTGTYGTGKSHLGLVAAASLSSNEGKTPFKTILKKIESKWRDKAKVIQRMTDSFGEKPLLFVYLEAEKIDYGTGFMDNSLILALKEALNKNGLSGLTPETAYDCAIKRIYEIKDKYLDTYKELERRVAAKEYLTVDNLILKLKQYQDKKPLNDFSILHKEVCSGAPFDIFSNLSAIDVYKSIVKAIKKKGYGGILLIWDEFTPVLRKLVADPESGEALNFQKFAQMCEGSGFNKVIFVTISHRTIEETIDIVSKETLKGDIAKSAEKISGRFRPISLGHIDKEAYYLMSGILLHSAEYENVKKRFNERFLDLTESIKKSNIFYNLNDKDLNILVYNLYPLHPTTTFVLSHMSDRIGQRNRSIFTYLCDSGESTFGSFLDKKTITDKSLPFILPKDILEYFLPLMKTTQDDKNIRKMTQAFFDRKLSIDEGDELSSALLKTVLLFNATKAVPATDDTILYSLGAFTTKEKQQIINKLQELRNKKILKKRLSDNGWYFYGLGTDTSIDDHLLEVIKDTEKFWTLKWLYTNALENINIKTYLRVIEADDYNTEKDIKRKIDLDFISSDELNNPDYLSSFIKDSLLDGKYYLVVASDENEGKFVKDKIVSDFKDFPNVLFAVPSDYTILNELTTKLKRFEAFNKLPEKYPIYQSELREELITERSDTEIFLKEKLEYILDPINGLLHFYYKGKKEDISASNQLKKLVSNMMYETFPYTPSIAREELVDDTRPDTLKKYRIPLIDAVLSSNAPTILLNDKDSLKQHLIEVFYKRHGILQMRKGERVIAKPKEKNEMANIWDTIENFIRTPVQKEINNLIHELKQPPYGLKKKTIGLIFAAVMRQYILDNQLVFYWKGNPIERINGEIIEDKIINKRQDVRVLFQEITEKHKLILKGLMKTFEVDSSDMEKVYRGIVNWWRGLPHYSRNTNKISDELQKIKVHFFTPLSSEEKDKKELFNTTLPDLLGFEDLSRISEYEIEDIVFSKMSSVRKDFNSLVESLSKEIERTVLACLGNREDIDNYYKKISPIVNISAITGDGKKLLQWIEGVSKTNTHDVTVLAEDILGRIDNWTDDSVIELKGHLESAKNAIESYYAQITEGPLPPDGKPPTEEDKEKLKNEIIISIKSDKRLHKFFTYYEDLETAPNKVQSKIIYDVIKSHIEKNIQAGQLTGDEIISIIYKLLLEVL